MNTMIIKQSEQFKGSKFSCVSVSFGFEISESSEYRNKGF